MNLVPSAYAADIAELFPPAKYFFSLGGLLNVVLPNLLIVAGIIAFLGVIVAGFKFISSSGDAKAQEASSGALTAAVIGLIIIFGAYFFVQLFETILGIPLLN